MRMPTALRNLDDRVIGSRRGSHAHDEDTHDSHDTRGRHDGNHDGDHDDVYPEGDGERVTRTERRPAEKRGNGDGVSSVLAVIWRVSRLVLIALALVLVLAIAFMLLPANEDNVIVRNVLSLAETVAGPLKDVFTVDDPERQRIYNYALAAVIYFVLASIVAKLPTGSKKVAG